MFAQHTASPSSNLLGFTALSVVAHAAIVAALILWVAPRNLIAQEKEVAITFMKVAPPPPPPPPPPPAAVRTTPKTTPKVTPKPKEIVIPKEVKPIEPPKVETPPEPEPAAEPPPAEPVEGGQVGGVEGGVAGGVVGGVLGGVVGGTLGGTGTAEPVKPKNVPPFVIQRDVVRQTPPRLSEVFKQTHRNSGTLLGMYRICVGTDGKVYEVTAVKSVPGADGDIISGIKDGWEYKPQKVPVCFLYNIPITIQ